MENGSLISREPEWCCPIIQFLKTSVSLSSLFFSNRELLPLSTVLSPPSWKASEGCISTTAAVACHLKRLRAKRQPGPCGNSARGSSRTDWAVHPANQSPIILGNLPTHALTLITASPSSRGAPHPPVQSHECKRNKNSYNQWEGLSVSGKHGLSRDNVPFVGQG